MGRYPEVINRFLDAFITNSSKELNSVLSDSVVIRFTTTGEQNGKSEAVSALISKPALPVHTVTAANPLSYIDGEDTVVSLAVQFLLADEEGPYLYPVLFGGRMVFRVREEIITRIDYLQEYQAENTLYLKDWTLAPHTSDYSFLSAAFDTGKALATVRALESDTDQLKQLTYLTAWALDSQNTVLLKQLTCPDVHFLRYKTMSYGTFESSSQDELDSYIAGIKEYYAADTHALAITDIIFDENGASVKASHLEPYRPGTKKLSSANKYCLFYDEDISLRFLRAEDGYLLNSFTATKISDIHTPKRTLLEV